MSPGEAWGEPRAPIPLSVTRTAEATPRGPYREPVPSPSPSPVLVVDALGVRIGIDLGDLDDADRIAVRAAWTGALAHGEAEPHATVTPTASLGRGPMLAALSSAVTLSAIHERRGELWMLHAAGVAGHDGAVVVLVGPSGAGKTTAIRLLAARAGYVSDETIALDATGAVLPYRKPLSVITDGVAHKVQHSPVDLGLGELPTAPLRLARIVLLDRRTEPTPARLLPVPISEAIAELAGQSSALAQLPGAVRTMADLIGQTGGVVRAEYAEAEDLATLVRGLLDAGAPTTVPSVMAPEATRRAPENTAGPRHASENPAGPRYARTQAVDWSPLPDGTLAVLTANADGSGVLRVLAGVAPTLWEAADGVPRDTLVAEVDARFVCPDPGAVTDAALASLVAAGLLRVAG